VTNKGRSTVTEATLSIVLLSHVGCLQLNPDNTCKRWMYNADVLTSDLRCKRVFPQGDKNDKRYLECQVKELLPGESMDVQIRMTYQPNKPEWTMQENSLTWEVKTSPGATGDAKSGNNKGEVRVILCQYGEGANGCKPPP
jgi:hypothetical protein